MAEASISRIRECHKYENKVWAKIDWRTLACVLFIMFVGAIVFHIKYEIMIHCPIIWFPGKGEDDADKPDHQRSTSPT
ncbi:MAG: hypothetical protein ACE5NP_10885, partial [Anaerolineae bacterium]